MGIRNVIAACYVYSEKISPEARLTLVVMATIAHDDSDKPEQARLYFGGWQLAMSRQGFWPDENAKRRFVRHVRELRDAGLVEVVSTSTLGRPAVYRLILPVDNFTFSVENSPDSVD